MQRMLRSRSRTALAVGLAGALGLTAVVLGAGVAAGQIPPQRRPPLQLPPEKQAVEDRYASMRAGGLSRPAPPKHPERYPLAAGPGPSPTPRKAAPETPAGAGKIVQSGAAPFPAALFTFENMWYEETPKQVTSVWAGADRADPAQGVVVVAARTNDYKPLAGGRFPTPAKAGSVRIVGATGERLSLVSSGGQKFTFDVEARKFVNP